MSRGQARYMNGATLGEGVHAGDHGLRQCAVAHRRVEQRQLAAHVLVRATRELQERQQLLNAFLVPCRSGGAAR